MVQNLWSVYVYNPLSEDSTLVSDDDMSLEDAKDFASKVDSDGVIVEIVNSLTGEIILP